MAAAFPEHFALRGDNGRYLRAHSEDGRHYLQFSANHADRSCRFRAEQRPDGYVRIRSDQSGLFWKLSTNNWILVDEDRPNDLNRYYDAFWPVWFDRTTVALRNGRNNNYCVRLTELENRLDCLNAATAPANITEATLVVEALGAGLP